MVEVNELGYYRILANSRVCKDPDAAGFDIDEMMIRMTSGKHGYTSLR